MLKKNLISNYFGQFWSTLMSFAFVPVYISYLGIEAYGVIGIYGVLQTWLSLLDLGMSPTLGREMAVRSGTTHYDHDIRNLLRSIEIIVLVISVVIVGVVWSMSNWLAKDWLIVENLSVDLVVKAFIIMGILSSMRFIEGIYRSCLLGMQQHVKLNLINSIMATFRGLGAVGALQLLSPTLEVFFLWQLGVSVLTVFMLAMTTYNFLPKAKIPATFSIKALMPIWKFAAGMLGIQILSLMLTQVDKIILSRLLSLGDYGYYTLGVSVAGTTYMVIGPIVQAWYPKFCSLYAKNQKYQLAITYHQASQLVTVLLGSFAIVIAFYSEELLYIWTKDKTLSITAAPIVSTLVIGNLLHGFMVLPYQMQLAHGWTSLSIKINIVALILIIPSLIWIVPKYGALGSAYVWLALNLFYILISIHFMYDRILTTEKFIWYIQDLLLPLLTILSIVMLSKAFDFSQLNRFWQIICLIIVGLFTCFFGVLSSNLLRPQLYNFIRKQN